MLSVIVNDSCFGLCIIELLTEQTDLSPIKMTIDFYYTVVFEL